MVAADPFVDPTSVGARLREMVPPARHLLRAKDLADSRYFEPLTVADLAREAGLSPAYFSREFRRTFGESPHEYLLTRRLERAAALLRNTDRSVTDICFAVGLASLGSFTTSFTRVHGMSPTAYRADFPPAAAARAHPELRGPRVRAAAEPHVSRSDGDVGFVASAPPTTRGGPT